MNVPRVVRLVPVIVLVLLGFLLTSCGDAGKSSHEHVGTLIVPKPAPGMVFGSSTKTAEAQPPAPEMPPAKVPLPPDIMVQQVIDTNLDIDDMDEQIVVFKKRESGRNVLQAVPAPAPQVAPNGAANVASGSPAASASNESGMSAKVDSTGKPTASRPAETVQELEARTANDAIWIMVIDFDRVRNTYVISWETPTLATNIRTFKVTTGDLLGDHNLEIVCQGTNAKGEQTIDVFRRVSSAVGVGLQFESILSLASDGSIDIQEQQRSEAYHSAQVAGVSFPIVTLTKAPGSKNPLDMVRTTYMYRSQDGRYVKAFQETVPGSRIAEAQLSELYNGSASSFEEFLNGPWYRVSGSSDSGQQALPTAQTTDIMLYDLHSRTITFAHGDIEQAFLIEESYKTSFQRGIQLKIQNQAIPTLHHFAAISVPALHTIVVTIQGDTGWDGTYKRLTGGLHQALFNNKHQGVTLSNFQLSGLYKSDNGTEMFFSPPRFTLRRNGTEHAGEFIIYRYGERVLELRILSDTGSVEQRHLYIMKYSEQDTKTQTVRVLDLTPATVSVHGFEPLNNEVQRYEQIEQKNQSAQSAKGS